MLWLLGTNFGIINTYEFMLLKDKFSAPTTLMGLCRVVGVTLE
jgi:hypothetical protein